MSRVKVQVPGGDSRSAPIGETDPIPVPGNNIDWSSGSGAPTNGASGTGVGTAGRGSLYTDTDTGNLYVNLGTISNVEWHGALLA